MPGIAIGLSIGIGGISRAWSPATSLTNAPTYLWDTAVAGTLTADVSNNVSAVADARATGTKTATGSGSTRPVLDAASVLDGRSALVYTHAAGSVLKVDAAGASLGNTPFALFEVADYDTSTDYTPSLTLGGSQTGGPFPENANLGCLGGRDWSGYLAQVPPSGGFTIGYNGSEGRLSVDTSRPCARLLVSDGTLTRLYVDGTCVSECYGLTWIIKSREIELGGTSVTGFSTTMDHKSWYGFAQYGAATMSEAEIRQLFGTYVRRSFPTLRRSRRAIVHGTSIDQGWLANGLAGAWLQLAADGAAHPWEVRNYSVVGMGAGKLPNANGTALYGVGGSVAAPTAGVAPNAAAQWSSMWDISPQHDRLLYFSGTLAVNDGYFGATAAEQFSYLQTLGALVIASGGTYVVCTPTPRQDAGVPVGYETERQALLTQIAAHWQGNLGAVLVHHVTNATPIAVTTRLPHGRTTGDTVTLAQVLGTTAANGTFPITVTGPTTFTLDTSVGNAAYTGAGVAYWGTGLGGTYLLDFAARAEFQDCTDTAYYVADKVHWKPALQVIAGTMAATLLDSVG